MSSSTGPRLEELSVERQCTLAYELWTALFSALVFACLREHDQDLIIELERRAVRRHQHKHFTDGLRKLGLGPELGDVVRCARYHYFSNTLGGLPMHYMEESPKRVWIRYLAPYWMGDGPTQPAAGPSVLGSAFGRAPFLGWHANNGAFLGNDRLVFVQTQGLADGDPWDAGYFTLHDRPLPPGEGYLRRVGEWGPRFDPARAPALPHTDWPAQRRAKALRNYGIDFTASRFSTLVTLVGTAAAARIVEHAYTVVLAQRADSLPSSLGLGPVTTPRAAAEFFAGVATINGDHVEIDPDAATVRQLTQRLWRDESGPIPEIDAAIARAWSNTLGLHGDGLRCRLHLGDPAVPTWIFETRSDG